MNKEKIGFNANYMYWYKDLPYYLTEAKLCANGKFYTLYPKDDNSTMVNCLGQTISIKLEIILNQDEFSKLKKLS